MHHSNDTDSVPTGSLERTILEDPVATACFDLDGTVLLWNPAAERLFGFTAVEALGHNPPTVPSSEFRTAYELVRRSARGETVEAVEIHRRRRDGSEIDLLLYGSPLRDASGAISGTISHYIDISERKRLEGALRQSVDDLEHRSREMSLLAELGELLESCQTVDEAHGVIGKMVGAIFPDDAGALYTLQPARNTAEAVAVWGRPPPVKRVIEPADCWGLRRGRMHVVQADEDPRCPHIAETIAAGAICAPLSAHSETLGMLHLQVRRERGPNVLTERGRVTQTLGEQLSVALANFRLREIMRSQSSRDPLTDLYNRRFMEESLYRELRRAAREGGSVGVLMVDIDHFKELNDTYGHAAGDVALRTVGEFLKAAVRGEDIACRYGGDEFVVILPKSSLADTEQRAQALRRDVKSLGVLGPNPIFPTLTMSIGVVAFPEHGGESAALLAAADRALYGAKTAGRDRVVVADVSDDVERVRSAEA